MTALAPSYPGSMAAHDDLVAAVNLFDGSEASFGALKALAVNCGMPDGADLVAWVRQRLASYGALIGIAHRAYATALDLIDSGEIPILSKVA